jgi:pimeloyl-ACP methyl ester carboxylesterase
MSSRAERRRARSRGTALTALVAAAAIALLGAGPLVLKADQSFYVGGVYTPTKDGDIMDGAMYVHALIPAKQTHKYPVVMIHGINSTGVTFETTADGREGWAQHFVRAGYAVYVVDQPARGRSPYRADLDGPEPRSDTASAQGASRAYTDPEAYNDYPQAKLHTQWPGLGTEGNAPFDNYMRGRFDSIPTGNGLSERQTKAAGAALLDRIGPAILLTHSQGGAFGWQIADARPQLVKAIIAVEPALSPTFPLRPGTAPLYGITTTPITYAPPVSDTDRIVPAPQAADSPDVSRCWLQSAPVRTLPTLHGIPIAVVIGEASPLAQSAQCVAHYLAQAGVPNDLIRLGTVGIHGNSHSMMLEKNSDDIAAFLEGWISKHGM